MAPAAVPLAKQGGAPKALCAPARSLPSTASVQGKRRFAPVMLRRLEKLGIHKTDPSDLTPDEVWLRAPGTSERSYGCGQ